MDMCAWLDVHRSSFYKWRHRGPSDQAKRREYIKSAVVITFDQYKQRYGAPRIAVELNETGIECSVNHIAELMAEAGLKARNGKKFKYCPSTKGSSNVSDDLLRWKFQEDRPDEKLVSVITYINVARGRVYLAVVMDLFSRQIRGWALGRTMTTELITDAFNMAVAKRQAKPGLILHSDRGVQYRSREYQLRLIDNGIKSSMSRKGNCWDNAVIESFFSQLKVESLHAESFKGIDDAYSSVFEYIGLFYNRVRRHSTIGYKSPVEYENDYYKKTA